MLSHRCCCCWRDEHLQSPRGEGHLDVCDDGSTCRAAPRPKWDSGGSLQRPRLVEQPAPRERTQIPVATQFLLMIVPGARDTIIFSLSSLWNRMRNQKSNHLHFSPFFFFHHHHHHYQRFSHILSIFFKICAFWDLFMQFFMEFSPT